MSLSLDEKAFLQQVSAEASVAGLNLYVVGGWVRDALLGSIRKDTDLDLVVEGDARVFARALADTWKVRCTVFDNFLTAKLSDLQGFGAVREIDFASTRTETYSRPGALPTVSLARTLDGDLGRRDFSVNALAYPLADLLKTGTINRQAVIDRHAGLADLDGRLVRTLHARSFADDPTRLIRACRYLARIEGDLEKGTREQFVQALQQGFLSSISASRQFRELGKCFLSSDRWRVLSVMSDLSLLPAVPLLGAAAASIFCGAAASLKEKPFWAVSPEMFFEQLLVHSLLKAGKGERELVQQLSPSREVQGRWFRWQGVDPELRRWIESALSSF